MASIKDQLIQIIKEQPDDSSYEEILRELAFAKMIRKGLEDSEQGRIITNEEMKKRISTWHK